MTATSTKPSVSWSWIAGLITIVGVVGAIVWGLTAYSSIGDRMDGFARTSLPGRLTAPLDTTGTYAVFFEAADTDGVPVLDLRATDPAGNPVPVDRYDAELVFEHDDTMSRAIATFEARTPGDYVVTASGDMPGPATFAVGRIPATGVAAVVGAVVLLFASIGAGIVIALVTLLLRNRHTARRATADGSPRAPAGVA